MPQIPIEAVQSITLTGKRCLVVFPPMSEAAFKKFCDQMGWETGSINGASVGKKMVDMQ